MTALTKLAALHHAFEAGDKSDFQRKARILQSLWREEHGFPIGEHNGANGPRQLGSRLRMPDAQTHLWNFLSDNIKHVVRREVLDPLKSRGKLFSKPRIFNDLLSSQPFCFNLFGELQIDLQLATSVMRAVSGGRVHKVIGIEFEESPGRADPSFTGDKSAFDVFVTFTTPAGDRSFVGIEVKYHENLLGEAATHKPRYDEIATIMDCFKAGSMACLKKQPLQQIWRDHLLAGILNRNGGFGDGYFLLLYPSMNSHCKAALDAYRNYLNCSDTFASLTLETLVAEVKKHTDADWVHKLYKRYLDFDEINGLAG